MKDSIRYEEFFLDEDKIEKTDREKEEESDMKDIVKMDEDYRVFEMVLEEGLSIGKISVLFNIMEEDEGEEELKEVFIIFIIYVIKFFDNKLKIFFVEDFSDDGDEFEEILVLKYGIV